MSGGVAPGWYPDPADTDTQRYWDGSQWIGAAVPVDVTPPSTPPATIRPTSPDHTRLPFPPAGTEPEPLFGELKTAPDLEVGGTRLAPPMVRLAARLFDIVAVSALTIVVNSYFFLSYYREVAPQVDAYLKAWSAGKPLPQLTQSAESTRLSVIMTLTAIALWFAYEVPATANSGQTLGKRLLGIKVVRLGAQQLTFWHSTRRWFVLALPSLLLQACGLPLQLVDCAWCTWDKPLQQCLHDKGVQTVVVFARPDNDVWPEDDPRRTP